MQQRHLGGVYSRGGAALTTGPLNPPVWLGRGRREKVQKEIGRRRAGGAKAGRLFNQLARIFTGPDNPVWLR